MFTSINILLGLCISLSGICYTKAHCALDIAKESQALTCSMRGKIQCPTSAPYNDVVISRNSTYRHVQTTGCPPYENPGWTNPAEACVFEQTYEFPIYPKVAKVPIPVGEILEVFEGITYLKEDPAPILGALGVLKNGVRIFGVGSPCGLLPNAQAMVDRQYMWMLWNPKDTRLTLVEGMLLPPGSIISTLVLL